jgi:hypothetical protein
MVLEITKLFLRTKDIEKREKKNVCIFIVK